MYVVFYQKWFLVYFAWKWGFCEKSAARFISSLFHISYDSYIYVYSTYLIYNFLKLYIYNMPKENAVSPHLCGTLRVLPWPKRRKKPADPGSMNNNSNNHVRCPLNIFVYISWGIYASTIILYIFCCCCCCWSTHAS